MESHNSSGVVFCFVWLGSVGLSPTDTTEGCSCWNCADKGGLGATRVGTPRSQGLSLPLSPPPLFPLLYVLCIVWDVSIHLSVETVMFRFIFLVKRSILLQHLLHLSAIETPDSQSCSVDLFWGRVMRGEAKNCTHAGIPC